MNNTKRLSAIAVVSVIMLGIISSSLNKAVANMDVRNPGYYVS